MLQVLGRLLHRVMTFLDAKDAAPVQVLDFAQVDSWRAQRTGFPEVVLGAGKSAEQIAAIMRQLAQNEQLVMATRVTPEVHCWPGCVSHAKPGNGCKPHCRERPLPWRLACMLDLQSY